MPVVFARRHLNIYATMLMHALFFVVLGCRFILYMTPIWPFDTNGLCASTWASSPNKAAALYLMPTITWPFYSSSRQFLFYPCKPRCGYATDNI